LFRYIYSYLICLSSIFVLLPLVANDNLLLELIETAGGGCLDAYFFCGLVDYSNTGDEDTVMSPVLSSKKKKDILLQDADQLG